MRTILDADSKDPLNRDEFYNMEVMLYEGLRIGLMTVFSYDKNYSRGAVQLAYSRDAMNWHRAVDRELFLPLSEDPADVDWGCIYPSQGPLVVGEEIWIYYTASSRDHAFRRPDGTGELDNINSICLAKLRLDGFVSVAASSNEGTFTTKALTFAGSHLVINGKADGGRIMVEILGAGDKAIEGFGRADCDSFSGNQICHNVTWNGKSDLSGFAGKAIRLRFYLKKAELFSFKFE